MRIQVVGGGSMGWNHIRVLKSLGHEVCVVEQDEERQKELRDTFSISVYDKICPYSLDEINAYVISTPTTTHYDIAKHLLETHAKPILIEKPVCATIEQAQEIKKLAEEKGVTIAVGHIERFNPIVTYTKDYIQDKFPRLINTYRLGFNNRITDVGVVADLAIHDVDILTYLAGSKITEVSSQHLVNPNTGHECYGKMLLTFENGIVGSSEVSWVHPKKIRKIEIVADQNFIESDYLTQTMTWHGTGDRADIDQIECSHTLKRMESLKLELEDFVSAIENNASPLVTIDQGIEALKVIEASYESFKTGKAVKL